MERVDNDNDNDDKDHHHDEHSDNHHNPNLHSSYKRNHSKKNKFIYNHTYSDPGQYIARQDLYQDQHEGQHEGQYRHQRETYRHRRHQNQPQYYHDRSPTASLIQSAARSVLDEATPDSIASDGGYEYEYEYNQYDKYSAHRNKYDDADDADNDSIGSESLSCADGNLGSLRKPSSPNLLSLQMETLPAIPDEQDRRCFIGCLAAIISSSYDFDEPDDDALDLDDEHSVPDYTFDLEEQEQRARRNQSISRMDSSTSDSNNNSNSNKNKNNNNVPTRAVSFDSTDGTDSATSSTFDTSKSATGASKFGLFAKRQSSVSSHGSSSNLSNRYLGPKLKQTWKYSSSKQKVRMSKQRHRRRRYDVLCKLLVSSSELLLLEKSVARAFVPMLDRVLVPRKDDDGDNNSNNNANNSSNNKSNSPVRQRKKSIARPPLPTNNRTSQSSPTSPAKKMDMPDSSNVSFSGSAPADATAVEVDAGVDDPDAHPEYIPEEVDKDDVLRPFLESLSPGAGFRCLSLLLLQYLLTSEVGYDARIRHILKKVAVVVLVRDMERDPVEHDFFGASDNNINGGHSRSTRRYREMATYAARKFESLEHSIARRLIRLSDSGGKVSKRSRSGPRGLGDSSGNRPAGITRKDIVRGVKIGSAGLVAGTLFALTGGLAAPGIAAGVAAVAGSAAATATVLTLTSTAVVTTIFGVGGGSLAAYKMQRRTQGLTEFEFRKETNVTTGEKSGQTANSKSEIEAELFSTICISGWLTDKHDFQRPWGLHPTHPRLLDRMELLERFYSVHSPDHVPKCPKILASWRGEERNLWSVLSEKYGRDPDHLFPLDGGARFRAAVTLEQEEVLDQIFVELGYNSVAPADEQKQQQESQQQQQQQQQQQPHQRHQHHQQRQPPNVGKQSTPFERMREGWRNRKQQQRQQQEQQQQQLQQQKQDQQDRETRRYDSLHGPGSDSMLMQSSSDPLASTGFSFDNLLAADTSEEGGNGSGDEKSYVPPKHLDTVWDYKTTYGGELYTVRWESELLKTICDCVMDFAMDVVTGATRQILKQTVLSTLLAAVIWPSYLLNLANMIDGDWTLAVERADEAGRALAKTLLFSKAGRRPVTLVGFSFGARVIYSCLKEMSKLQDEWEDYQELCKDPNFGKSEDDKYFNRLKEKFEGMREPASVIEDTILMGLPNHLSLPSWKACRQVVAGRLVNCYSTKDMILSLMFQAKRFSGGSLNNGMGSILKPVCGTCPVEEPGVENIDVTDLVSGHQDYCLVTGKILERVCHGQPLRFVSATEVMVSATVTTATTTATTTTTTQGVGAVVGGGGGDDKNVGPAKKLNF